MNKYIIYQLIVLVSAFLVGCTEDDTAYSEPQMVVEGWIESGGRPFVRVTSTVPISKKYQSVDSLDKYMLAWADVTVSDGEKTVSLRRLYSKKYNLNYIFSTDEIVGVPGRTYTLTVDYHDFHATAQTTIPQPVAVDSFRVEPLEGNDTLYHIRAFVHDNPAENNCYEIFVREDKGQRSVEFYPAYLGVFNSGMLKDNSVFVNNARNNLTDDDDKSQYFRRGSKVQFKLAHINSDAYEFWRKFEDVASFSRVPSLTGDYSLPGNVSGALGYWFGYGVTTCSAVIP